MAGTQIPRSENYCHILIVLLLFTVNISAFIPSVLHLQQCQLYNTLESQPSYIDKNEIINSELSENYNSGLGKEKLIYVDNDIIIVDKPSCCSTAPGFREPDSLASRIAEIFHIDRIDKMIVHRLDYATSGLVVFARNDNALTSLHTQFRLKNKVYKKYSAIVKGYLNNFEGEMDLPLGKDKNSPPLCMVDPQNGKNSLTSWILRGRHNGNSHVHLRPHTGRTHQLRIHLASAGHPILGDLFYAPKPVYLESKRLLLHAEELGLVHPRTNHPLCFISKCPFSLYDGC